MHRRFALGALMITILTAAATSTATLLEISDDVAIIRQGAKIPDAERFLDDVDAGKPQTILILGSDRRYADRHDKSAARSDTILLIRLDPSKEATAVLSIPRDLMVDIPGYGRAKINEAYSAGGPNKTVETIKSLFHFPINHVINVNFGGFREAVDRLGCVYLDIDRRYFNDNNPPFASDSNYATIDIQPGYQKLCGSDALDWVRFRHLDTDFVRASRQQEFLRAAKDQFGLGQLFKSRKALLRIFARYTQTDIRDRTATLRLLKLAFQSASHPVREVKFRGDIAGDTTLSYVDVTPENLELTRSEFLDPKARRDTGSGGHKPREHFRVGRLAAGMIADWAGGLSRVTGLRKRAGFPVYYPGHRLETGGYDEDPPRLYDVRDRKGERFQAYRIVVDAGVDLGQYYGIQGTTWQHPPILDDPSETRELGGQKYELFYDGKRLRVVALRTPSAVYWVSNTLSQTLTNAQMLDIATSLRRVGARG
ncbi:MAG: LCP family protein [Solirubrobacteraceae bacterium]